MWLVARVTPRTNGGARNAVRWWGVVMVKPVVVELVVVELVDVAGGARKAVC